MFFLQSQQKFASDHPTGIDLYLAFYPEYMHSKEITEEDRNLALSLLHQNVFIRRVIAACRIFLQCSIYPGNKLSELETEYISGIAYLILATNFDSANLDKIKAKK